MAVDGNQTQKEKKQDFGLPKATFKPIEPTGSSNWLKITAIIVFVVLIIGAGVVYWLFKRSSSSYQEFIGKTFKKQTEENIVPEEENLEELRNESITLSEDTPELIEELRQEAEVQEKMLVSNSQGTIEHIQARQGAYYVIVSSHIDKDLAIDYGKKILKQHPYVSIIAPEKGKHFYRLAIEKGMTFKEAQEKANDLKAIYGDQLWVLKY